MARGPEESWADDLACVSPSKHEDTAVLRRRLQRALIQNEELKSEVAEQRVSILLQKGLLSSASSPSRNHSPNRGASVRPAPSSPAAERGRYERQIKKLQGQVVELNKRLDVYRQQPTMYQQSGRRGGGAGSPKHGQQQVLLGRKTREKMVAQEERMADLDRTITLARAETRAEAESRLACEAARAQSEAIATELAAALTKLTGAYEDLERQLATAHQATHEARMEADAAAIAAHAQHVSEAAATARQQSAAREKAERKINEVVEEVVAEAGERFESAMGRSAWQAVTQAEEDQAARAAERASFVESEAALQAKLEEASQAERAAAERIAALEAEKLQLHNAAAEERERLSLEYQSSVDNLKRQSQSALEAELQSVRAAEGDWKELVELVQTSADEAVHDAAEAQRRAMEAEQRLILSEQEQLRVLERLAISEKDSAALRHTQAEQAQLLQEQADFLSELSAADTSAALQSSGRRNGRQPTVSAETAAAAAHLSLAPSQGSGGGGGGGMGGVRGGSRVAPAREAAAPQPTTAAAVSVTAAGGGEASATEGVGVARLRAYRNEQAAAASVVVREEETTVEAEDGSPFKVAAAVGKVQHANPLQPTDLHWQDVDDDSEDDDDDNNNGGGSDDCSVDMDV